MAKLRVKQYLACEVCAKEFGGPAGGDYQEWDHKTANLADFLMEEAIGMFWIKITCGAAEVLVCSKKCAKHWLYDEDCYGNN